MSTINMDNFTSVRFYYDNVNGTTTSNTHTVWLDEMGHFNVDPYYSGGTKLLRDYAMRSNEYLEKKEISQAGWKSRYDLRNV